MTPKTDFHTHLTVRRGQASDAALLSGLGARTFAETFAADNSPENMAAYLNAAFNPEQQAAELADTQSSIFIAEINGVAVGYAMLRSGSAPAAVTGDNPIELVRLYVSRASLGSGVGAALMQACIDDAKQGGYHTLWLGVWERNPRAQAFYRKWNFVEVGVHVFKLGDDPQTDLLMQRLV